MHVRIPLALSLATVTALGVVALDVLVQARYSAERRSESLQHLSAVRARLESGLNSRLYLIDGLSSYVALHPDLDPAEFEALARGLIAHRSGIRSIQLARDTVVSHVYPRTGNEAAVGLRLLELQEQAGAVRRALATRRTVLAGPVDLVQGGIAFISRTPVYRADAVGEPGPSDYWGLATILIDAPTLYEEAGLTADRAQGWRVALRGVDGAGANGKVFFGDESLYDDKPEVLDIALPGGTWQLAIVPARGWDAHWPGRLWLWAGGALLVLLTGIAAWLWARYPARLRNEVRQATAALDRNRRQLERIVEQRTAELTVTNQALRESESRLAEAQEIAGLGNWERDVGSGAVYWSDEIFAIFGLRPGEVEPSYESFLNAVHPEERERVMETVEGALKHGDAYDIDHRVQRPDGSVRVVHEQARIDRSPDGTPLRLVGTVLDITERSEAERQLEYLAYHDPLTGLPNRFLLRDRLEHAVARARRHDHGMALLFIDLDRFKNVNDSLGHIAGDQLLIEVSRRLSARMRDDDTLARLGGDEFTVVLERIDDLDQVRNVVRKIMQAFADTFVIQSREVFVTASIGISMYPDDGADVDVLMSNADAAMYQAKGHGRNDFRFFSEQLSAQAHERLAMEAGLRRAEERGELMLYYQPMVDAASRRVVALEALLRWQHPEFGTIEPARFVPVAEDSGLILPIGRWVLGEVCRHVQGWRSLGLPEVRVFANLSARQLMHDNLADDLEEMFARCSLDPSVIGLEITESMLLGSASHLDETLGRFRELGVQVAVDDFGVGQSALVYLKRFAVDSLKIDRTFVRDVTTDPNDAAIIEAIVAMAHKLNLTVVAEGVETSAQESAVRHFGCDLLQGYLYHKPMPADAVPSMLHSAANTIRQH